MAHAITRDEAARDALATIRQAAEAVGRDPASIGLQQMLDVPPTDEHGKAFYADTEQVARRAEQVQACGFEWGAINATAIFQSGARSVTELIDSLKAIHERVRGVTG